ncbi:MAG: sigma-70 family RNA polymerase sigma factor [Saprospiraceae bacterium]|nr:sigma-70 family RNA polymerase sigma factor [Candidatus Vicinibacter proximus]MCC6841486.1 sigma-70 family RNA polymerase sigma factor [Saprospiraceae bacterium]
MDIKPIIHSEDQRLFQDLKSGNMQAFDQIYLLYRDDFVRTARHRFSSMPEADIVDAWQDALVSFFEQISSGRLHTLSCSIKSFLYLIGFRYIMKSHHLNLKTDHVESFSDKAENLHFAEEMDLMPELNDEQILLNARIKELPEQSKRMLLLRYVDGKSIPEIAQEMNYQSDNSVSVTLSRTLKKLKELLEKDVKR